MTKCFIMRIMSVVTMISFWCNFVYFVSSCGSADAVEIVKFVSGEDVKIIFEIHNIGPDATSYAIMEMFSEPFTVMNPYSENNITPNDYDYTKAVYEISHDKLTDDVVMNIQIALYTGNKHHCSTTRVVDFELQRQRTRASERNRRCSGAEGCIISVNLKNKCQASSPKKQTALTEVETNRKSRTEYIKIYKNGVHNSYNFIFNEGQNVTIVCETDYEAYFIRWIQKKGDQNIFTVDADENQSSSLNMNISRFDNGTIIKCLLCRTYEVAPNQWVRKDFDASGDIMINVKYEKNTKLYDVTNATSKKTVSYYDFRELTCTGHLRRWIKLSKDGLIERSLEDQEIRELPLTLGKADNNSLYMCLGISRHGRKPTYKREISNLVQLAFSTLDNNSAGYWVDDMPLIAGAVGGVAGLLLLAVLLCICSKKAKPRQPSPFEVETYACPSTVQYVDLQTVTANPRRCVTKDETPYARIVGILEPTGR